VGIEETIRLVDGVRYHDKADALPEINKLLSLGHVDPWLLIFLWGNAKAVTRRIRLETYNYTPAHKED
jgi:hypothetical protein